MFQTELANKEPCKTNIDRIRLRLVELQESDKKAQKIRAESLNRYKDVNRVLYY